MPWYTGQRQFSPRNSYTDLLECSLMMSSSKSNCDKMMHCSSRRNVSRLLYELLDTSKPCAATIAARSRPGVSRKATLFFGVFSPPRIPTS